MRTEIVDIKKIEECDPAAPETTNLTIATTLSSEQVKVWWMQFIKACKKYFSENGVGDAEHRHWDCCTFDSYDEMEYRITMMVCEGSPTRGWIVLDHKFQEATIQVGDKIKRARFSTFIEKNYRRKNDDNIRL